MKKLSVLLIAILLSACGAQGIDVPQSPVLKILEPKSGLIAYIGNDGNVYITDQAANKVTQITEDLTAETQGTIAYRLPSWSRAGDQLAFVRLEQTNSTLATEIFITNAEDKTTRSVYTSNSEFPIYLNWAPDGENISVLTTTSSQNSLALQKIPVNGGEPSVLDTGNPFFWSWAPDGKNIIVHKNNGNPNAVHQVSFLKLEDEITEFVSTVAPGSFQAPAWSPDGAHILLTSLTESGKQELTLLDSTGEVQKSITELEVNASFAWASDSQQFAYIKGTKQLNEGALGSLHVGNINTDEEIVVDETVFAYFWSPDALEIAYLIPFVNESEETGERIVYFTLFILDTKSGESREVVTFQPTEGFLSIVPYIDQYHQSFTIWSPDSNNLVISFMDASGVSGLAIVPTSGITEPRILVEGSLAVWSWK